MELKLIYYPTALPPSLKISARGGRRRGRVGFFILEEVDDFLA